MGTFILNATEIYILKCPMCRSTNIKPNTANTIIKCSDCGHTWQYVELTIKDAGSVFGNISETERRRLLEGSWEDYNHDDL